MYIQDHLVVWVKKYLCKTHSKKGAKCIIDDINQRIATVPAFIGIYPPQGQGFKQ
ncbi:uncharacterized protein BJ212DRAFT_1293876 [Suillus subaureus]|uniref:Uncharacterized protein n=1 Tax=Suillus subaureus TaxID=48587 RepID=A0A9P7AKU4_9AGAM|nr:uncharacterized protein BJ212DRAFT_1293876 [Suillus subaureus]KAG1791491.1 hypothetical protein BJ212DRAFT_1293876 [Suillus subaureus]